MNNTDFLFGFGSNATLKVKTADGLSIDLGVNLDIIGDPTSCPTFAAEFEETGTFGELRKTIMASSANVVICFLRFLYLDSYVFDETNPELGRLLLHIELHKMAEAYSIEGLKNQTRQNIRQELERSCYLPHPPQDLCEALRFIYNKPYPQTDVIGEILHYICGCFSYHNLGLNKEFTELFYHQPQLSRDLSRTNMERGFQDEGATEIINLQGEYPQPKLQIVDGYFQRNNYPVESWCRDYDTESMSEYSSFSETEDDTFRGRALTYRPRRDPGEIQRVREERRKREQEGWADSEVEDSSASASEVEGYTLVRRPRALQLTQSSTLREINNGPYSIASVSFSQTQVFTGHPGYGNESMDDPFADPDPGNEADFNDAASISSVETLKFEEINTASGERASALDSNERPTCRPSQSSGSDVELLHYESSSDSDWSVV